MTLLSLEQKNSLRNQIEMTIKALIEAKERSYEAEIEEYQRIYQRVADKMNINDEINIDVFKPLQNRARSYLETSSVWDQAFLHEMGKTESLIKDIINT